MPTPYDQNYYNFEQFNYQVHAIKQKIKKLRLSFIVLLFCFILTGMLGTVLLLLTSSVVTQNQAAVNNDINLFSIGKINTQDKDTVVKSFYSPLNKIAFAYNSIIWNSPLDAEGSVSLSIASVASNDTNTLNLTNIRNVSISPLAGSIDDNFVSKKITEIKSEMKLNNETLLKEGTVSINSTQVHFLLLSSDRLNLKKANSKMNVIYYIISLTSGGFLVKHTSTSSISEDENSLTQILSSLRFVVLDDSKNVKGASDSQNTDFIQRAVLENRSGVHRVFAKRCGTYSFSLSASLPNYTATFGGKKLSTCVGGSGSGFVIDDKGDLATNGHVVESPDPKTIFLYTIAQNKQYLKVFLQDIVGANVKTGALSETQASSILQNTPSDELLGSVLSYVSDLFDNGVIKTDFGDTTYLIQKHDSPIDPVKLYSYDSNESEGKKAMTATVLDKDYNPDDLINKKFTASDVAILHVGNVDLLTVPLGSLSTVTPGGTTVVIGFPGSGTDNTVSEGLADKSSTTEQTVTRGVISAIKKDSSGTRNLIQIDAYINHGNSGGPCFDNNGLVIGIATYGVSNTEDQTNTINFCRDVADLQALMHKNKIVNNLSTSSMLWRSAVDQFNQKKYFAATTKFTELKSQNVAIQDLQKLNDEAQVNKANAIDDPSLVSPQKIGFVSGISILVLAIILLIILVIILIMMIINQRKYKQMMKVIMAYPQQMRMAS